MDDGLSPNDRAPFTTGVRTSAVDSSLRAFYYWVCVGILIIAGMMALSAVIAVYYAAADGAWDVATLPAALRVLALASFGGAAIFAVRGLRVRHAPTGYGRFTAIASIYFGLAVVATLLFGAVTR